MLLTKECDYAIRIVQKLSSLDDGLNQETVSTICDSEHIPVSFAYKILMKLKKAGIVSSVRGMAGGYLLSKAPDSISVFDVLRAVDANLFINECLKPGHACQNNDSRSTPCNMRCVLEQLQDNFVSTLSQTTITQIL